jgi:S1-C subfamily serine protease
MKPLTSSAALILAVLLLVHPAAFAKPATETRAEAELFDYGWREHDAGRHLEACEVWQRLARQGHVLAQINLGAMYDTGKGFARNPVKAAQWYRMAAEIGNAYAQYNLGQMYAEGRGVDRDMKQAYDWFRKSAEQGLSLAQFQLGLIFAEADGDRFDPQTPQHVGISGSAGPKGATSSPGASTPKRRTNRQQAIQWFFRSGLSYLAEDDIDGARKAWESITELDVKDSSGVDLLKKIQARPDPSGAGFSRSVSEGASIGTAWPIDSGYVITNNHVISESDDVILMDTDGNAIKAWPVVRDEVNDVALLAVDDTSRLPPALPLAREQVDEGDPVFTIGFPRIDVLGPLPKPTQGTISRLQGLDDDPAIYQTTVPIQPGNSGGPLLNMQGEVVGVVRSIIGYRSVSGGSTVLLQDASCALKIDKVKEIFYHLPQNAYVLSALPRGLDDVEALSRRVQNSMLIVIAR